MALLVCCSVVGAHAVRPYATIQNLGSIKPNFLAALEMTRRESERLLKRNQKLRKGEAAPAWPLIRVIWSFKVHMS